MISIHSVTSHRHILHWEMHTVSWVHGVMSGCVLPEVLNMLCLNVVMSGLGQ
jgi:hypothetical protein